MSETPQAQGPAALTRRLEELNRQIASAMESTAREVAEVGRQTANGLLEAIARIDGEDSQSGILVALLAEGRRFASRTAFFLVRNDGILGWGAQGFGRAATDLEGLGLDYEGPWANLAKGQGTVRLGGDECAALLSKIDVSSGAEGLLIPFVLRGQIAGAVYADRLDGDAELVESSLQLLTHSASQAVEILAFRSRKTSPSLHFQGEDETPGLPLWQKAEAATPALEPIPEPEVAPAVEPVVTPEPVAVEPAIEPAAVVEPVVAEPEPTLEPMAVTPEPAVEPVAVEPVAVEPPAIESMAVTPEPYVEPAATMPDPVTPEPVTQDFVAEPVAEVAPDPIPVAEPAPVVAEPEAPQSFDAPAADAFAAPAGPTFETVSPAPDLVPEPELEDTSTDMWALEEDEDDEPTAIGMQAVKLDPPPAAAAPPAAEPVPEPAPLPSMEPAPEPAPAEPAAAPAQPLGQQTVRLDISALQGQAAANVTPAAPEPPAPEPAAPATFAAPAAEPAPAAPATFDQAAAYVPPPAEPVQPAAPAEFAATESGSFAAPDTGAYVPPPAAPAEPKPEATSDGGSTQVAPPDDLQGPGSAFKGSNEREGAEHDEARRLARLLVSEIKLYNEELIEEGRRDGNIYERLKDDIDRSRQMYDERVSPEISASTDYFYEELVQRLAGGNPSILGM